MTTQCRKSEAPHSVRCVLFNKYFQTLTLMAESRNLSYDVSLNQQVGLSIIVVFCIVKLVQALVQVSFSHI